MNISNNISSLQANQMLMDTNANNIANANTDGFRPQDTSITNDSDGNIQAQNRTADDTGSQKSQTDLAKEIPDQITGVNIAKANAVSIRAEDEVLGTLLDMKA